MADFVWTVQSVRWMCDAAGDNDYFPALAERIGRYLPADARVLELGCGIGALAKALAPHCKSVTALDSSPLALTALEPCPPNVSPVCADAFCYAPTEPYDAMVLCYFSRPDEFLKLCSLCNGIALLICDARRSTAFEERLTARGRAFSKECFSLSFDQPLRSLEEAQAYAAYYARPLADKADDPVFPYRDKIMRDMALLSYACGDAQ